MSEPDLDLASAALFPGGGVTGALLRGIDWSRNPLGPATRWPAELKTMVRMMLQSRQPIFIFWGPELIHFYNDATLPILGEKHPRAFGQRSQECWSEAWPTIGPQIDAVMQRGEAVSFHGVLVPVLREGRLGDAWWNYSYSPLFDEPGAIAGTLCVVTEVTGEVAVRAQLETARREAEQARQTLQSALMQAPVPLCILSGREHRYTLANAPLVSLVGREVVGRTVREAFDEAEAGDYLPVLDHVYDTGEATVLHESPAKIANRDGVLEDYFIDVAYSPHRGADGAVIGVLLSAHDVSAQVRARMELERALRERQKLVDLIEQSSDFIAIATPDGAGLWCNQPGMRLLGLSGLDAVRGTSLIECIAPHDRARVRDEVLPTVAREGRWAGELDFRHFGTGESIPVWYSIFEMRDAESGEVTALGTVTRELRAQKALERAQVAVHARERQQREEAETANRAKDEFLATVSHELRTPLTAILGWAQILSSNRDPARTEKGLAIIERNAKSQAKLIEDILDVSRIISGKVVLGMRRVDLASVIRNAVDSIRPAADAKELRLVVDLANVATGLVADEERLQQVVWNLLSNSVKFTPKGGVVTVCASGEASRVVIRVHDTGKGIPARFLPHIFERFRQADASTTKQQAGLGLGLAIVRHLVELHGGTIRASSAGEGQGASFEIVLPIRAVEPQPARDESLERSTAGTRLGTAPSSANGRLRGVHVLVVDDQEDARDLVATVLADAGARVTQADSAAAAMKIFAVGDVTAIVSDVGMPGEDGYSFIGRVRASPDSPRHRDVPALALTAYARSEDRDRALASGFQEHLAKPIDPDRLIDAVAGLVQR